MENGSGFLGSKKMDEVGPNEKWFALQDFIVQPNLPATRRPPRPMKSGSEEHFGGKKQRNGGRYGSARGGRGVCRLEEEYPFPVRPCCFSSSSMAFPHRPLGPIVPRAPLSHIIQHSQTRPWHPHIRWFPQLPHDCRRFSPQEHIRVHHWQQCWESSYSSGSGLLVLRFLQN